MDGCIRSVFITYSICLLSRTQSFQQWTPERRATSLIEKQGILFLAINNGRGSSKAQPTLLRKSFPGFGLRFPKPHFQPSPIPSQGPRTHPSAASYLPIWRASLFRAHATKRSYGAQICAGGRRAPDPGGRVAGGCRPGQIQGFR